VTDPPIEPIEPIEPVVDQLDGTPVAQTPAARLAAYVRAGGVVVPLLTALLAFVIGGLVVLVTGHDPIATYKAIFEGTG
jgi:general nucleoside transport system permease protein